MELIFVTTNRHKVQEIRALAESKHITIEQLDYDYPELQRGEIEEVAKESAMCIRAKAVIKKPFFLEDSGLFIHALNGFPGPFSAYVFNTIGNEGILRLMADKKGEARGATFKTVVAFCESVKDAPILFVGTAEGRIAEKVRGEGGFGYDPIFEFDKAAKTFAEMSAREKNAVSHRGKAFRKLLTQVMFPLRV
jgi:XTP/dITP diphosphohydrolase